MKKIILLVSILVFSLAVSLVCFGADNTEPVESTYSVETFQYFYTRYSYGRQSVRIILKNMPERYVFISSYRYIIDNSDDSYYLEYHPFIYDKIEKKVHYCYGNNADGDFIQSFFDSGQITIINNDGIYVTDTGILYPIDRSDYLKGIEYQSDNYALPYCMATVYSFDSFPFDLDLVEDKGQWFIEGNNYPYNKNSVYSELIYYPSATAKWSDFYKPSAEHEDYNIYVIDFELESGGNVKYKDLTKYYFEIWTSSEDKPDLVFQSSYKLSEITSIQGVNYNGYQLKAFYNKMFPYAIDFQNSSTNVYVRMRYVDNDVNLVSTFSYWTQKPHLEEPIVKETYISKDNLPVSKKPSEIIPDSFNPGSLQGNYNFGDFNALDFVKGGGGLSSLTRGVSTVFSFLPSWIWQMLWYVLGALAVIALLKVIIS